LWKLFTSFQWNSIDFKPVCKDAVPNSLDWCFFPFLSAFLSSLRSTRSRHWFYWRLNQLIYKVILLRLNMALNHYSPMDGPCKEHLPCTLFREWIYCSHLPQLFKARIQEIYIFLSLKFLNIKMKHDHINIDMFCISD